MISSSVQLLVVVIFATLSMYFSLFHQPHSHSCRHRNGSLQRYKAVYCSTKWLLKSSWNVFVYLYVVHKPYFVYMIYFSLRLELRSPRTTKNSTNRIAVNKSYAFRAELSMRRNLHFYVLHSNNIQQPWSVRNLIYYHINVFYAHCV